jgi:hypothetical protein
MRGKNCLGVVGKQFECVNYTTSKEWWDEYRQHQKWAEDTAAHPLRVRDRAKYNFSVLLGEDGGFPEASLNDGSAAELGGLKRKRER